MKKQFYSHIIEVNSLFVALDGLELSAREKEHLQYLIDSSLYHTILDAILSELPEGEKQLFLDKVAADNHEETMDFLQKRITNIEEKIKKTADDLVKELHEDIKEVKKK